MEQTTTQISGFKYFLYTIAATLIMVLIIAVLYYQHVYTPNTETGDEFTTYEPVDESAEISKNLNSIEKPEDTDILSSSDVTTVLKNINATQDKDVTALTQEERETVLKNIKTLEE